MSAPETLSRPLAARVANLPEPAETVDNPQVSQAVIEAAVDALKAGKTHYTDRPGILPLRTQITEDLKQRFELELSPDEVTITCGVTEARFVALKLLAKAGSQVFCLLDKERITGAAQLVGAEVVGEFMKPLPETASLAYASMKDSWDDVDAIIWHAAKYNWWVIWEIGSQRPNFAQLFKKARENDVLSRLVLIGELSDTLPGWRVGWMAGSKMANKLRAYKQSMTICTTSISQWAGLGLAK